jgi:hypothetical protein
MSANVRVTTPIEPYRRRPVDSRRMDRCRREPPGTRGDRRPRELYAPRPCPARRLLHLNLTIATASGTRPCQIGMVRAPGRKRRLKRPGTGEYVAFGVAVASLHLKGGPERNRSRRSPGIAMPCCRHRAALHVRPGSGGTQRQPGSHRTSRPIPPHVKTCANCFPVWTLRERMLKVLCSAYKGQGWKSQVSFCATR